MSTFFYRQEIVFIVLSVQLFFQRIPLKFDEARGAWILNRELPVMTIIINYFIAPSRNFAIICVCIYRVELLTLGVVWFLLTRKKFKDMGMNLRIMGFVYF